VKEKHGQIEISIVTLASLCLLYCLWRVQAFADPQRDWHLSIEELIGHD